MNSAIKKYRDFSPVAAIKAAIKTILGLIGDLVKTIASTLADLGRSAVKTVSDPRMATPLLILVLANMKKVREILSKIRNKVNETKSEAKSKDEWEVIFGNGPTYEKQHAERMKNVTNKAAKKAEKEAREAAKKVEKQVREAAKQAEKQKKQAEKEAKSQAKQAAKQAKSALNIFLKEQKKAEQNKREPITITLEKTNKSSETSGRNVKSLKGIISKIQGALPYKRMSPVEKSKLKRSSFEYWKKMYEGTYETDLTELSVSKHDNLIEKERKIREEILNLNVSDDIKKKYAKELFKLLSPYEKALSETVSDYKSYKKVLEQKFNASVAHKEYDEEGLAGKVKKLEKLANEKFSSLKKEQTQLSKDIEKRISSLVKKANKEESDVRKKAEKIAKEAAKIEKKAESIKKKLDPSVKQTLGEAGKNIVKEVGSAVAKTVISSAGSAVIGAIGASKQKNKKALGGPKQLSLFGDAKSLKQKIRRLKDARCL